MAAKKTRKPRRPSDPPARTEPKPAVTVELGEQTFVEWEAGLTEREKRVEQVLEIMLSGGWLGGVTDKALAKRWGCTPANVRKVSAEANRVLRARLRDDPQAKLEIRAQILQNFEVIRAKAMLKGDSASLRVALDAIRAYGFYLGIEPAKKLDLTDRTDPFEGWTTDEKLAYANDGRRPRRAIGRIGAGEVEH